MCKIIYTKEQEEIFNKEIDDFTTGVWYDLCPFEFVDGQEYEVIWDGVSYIATCGYSANNSVNTPVIGDYGNNYPFAIYNTSMDSYLCIVVLAYNLDGAIDKTNTSHTVIIKTHDVKPIPEKYLPDLSNIDISEIQGQLDAKAPIDHTHTAEEVGALPSETVIPGTLADLTDDSTHRTVTDEEKAAWNSKSNANHTHTAAEIGADASGSAANALEVAKTYTNTKIAELINGAPTTLDTLGEIVAAMEENVDVVSALDTAIGSKANVSDLTDLSEQVSTERTRITNLEFATEAASTEIQNLRDEVTVLFENYNPMPDVTTSDAGKFMRVSPAGVWVAEAVPRAEEVEF